MPQATMATCPKCGAKVRKEKLRRHVNAVHGDAPKAPKVESSGTARVTVGFPWKMLGALVAVAALVVGGYWVVAHSSSGGGPTDNSTKIVVMETNYGTIKIQLDMSRAPRTAAHFIDMVNRGLYTPNSFHRIAANFVIQGGQSGGATGVNWENTGLRNVKYSIAMARSGDPNKQADSNTATSQFFISLKDNPSLDGYAYPYVVFGHVIEGQAAVNAIGLLYPPGQPSYDGPPSSPATITRVTVT